METEIKIKYEPTDTDKDRVVIEIQDELKQHLKKVCLDKKKTDLMEDTEYSRHLIKSHIANDFGDFRWMFHSDLMAENKATLNVSYATMLKMWESIKSEYFQRFIDSVVNYGEKTFTLKVKIE